MRCNNSRRFIASHHIVDREQLNLTPTRTELNRVKRRQVEAGSDRCKIESIGEVGRELKRDLRSGQTPGDSKRIFTIDGEITADDHQVTVHFESQTFGRRNDGEPLRGVGGMKRRVRKHSRLSSRISRNTRLALATCPRCFNS